MDNVLNIFAICVIIYLIIYFIYNLFNLKDTDPNHSLDKDTKQKELLPK